MTISGCELRDVEVADIGCDRVAGYASGDDSHERSLA